MHSKVVLANFTLAAESCLLVMEAAEVEYCYLDSGEALGCRALYCPEDWFQAQGRWGYCPEYPEWSEGLCYQRAVSRCFLAVSPCQPVVWPYQPAVWQHRAWRSVRSFPNFQQELFPLKVSSARAPSFRRTRQLLIIWLLQQAPTGSVEACPEPRSRRRCASFSPTLPQRKPASGIWPVVGLMGSFVRDAGMEKPMSC